MVAETVVVQEPEQIFFDEPEILTSEEEIVTSNSSPMSGTGSGDGIGSDFFVGGCEEVVGNAEEVIQVKEEEIPMAASSETEMSVAMEMARLSQGLVHNNLNSSYEDENNYSDSENTTPPPYFNDNENDSDFEVSHEKPRMSYAQLIAEALLSRQDRMLTLSEIYQAINRKWPYYKMEVKSWQNAIRHNLTLNPAFTKIPRPSQEGRGNFWRIEQGAEKIIFKRQIRNHHYNRRSAGLPGPSQRALLQQQKEQERVLEERRKKEKEQLNAVNSISRRPEVLTEQQPPAKKVQRVHIIKTAPGAMSGITTNGVVKKQPQILRLKESIVQPNGSVVFIALPTNMTTTRMG